MTADHEVQRQAADEITEAIKSALADAWTVDVREFYVERILSALAEAGYTVVRTDGWEYGVTEPLDNDRVYASGLVFCEHRIQTRRLLVERDGADPSSVPVLMRRPKLAPGPWVPVPEGSAEEGQAASIAVGPGHCCFAGCTPCGRCGSGCVNFPHSCTPSTWWCSADRGSEEGGGQ